MKVRKIRNAFAAEVLEFSAKKSASKDIQKLREALSQYGVIVLRNQNLTKKDYIRFAGYFGNVEAFPIHPSMKKYPEIFPVSNFPEGGHIYEGRFWHTDSIDEDRPSPMTLFYSHLLPRKGGDTLFINTHDLYQSFSPGLKKSLESLEAVYRSGHIHPLIQPHPINGLKCLFIHFGLIYGIRGMDLKKGQAIIKRLHSKFENWCKIYRHRYKSGDLVIWDNAQASHIAGGTDPKYPRIMYRITISGD
jgi:taurine dioxygenase